MLFYIRLCIIIASQKMDAYPRSLTSRRSKPWATCTCTVTNNRDLHLHRGEKLLSGGWRLEASSIILHVILSLMSLSSYPGSPPPLYFMHMMLLHKIYVEKHQRDQGRRTRQFLIMCTRRTLMTHSISTVGALGAKWWKNEDKTLDECVLRLIVPGLLHIHNYRLIAAWPGLQATFASWTESFWLPRFCFIDYNWHAVYVAVRVRKSAFDHFYNLTTLWPRKLKINLFTSKNLQLYRILCKYTTCTDLSFTVYLSPATVPSQLSKKCVVATVPAQNSYIHSVTI